MVDDATRRRMRARRASPLLLAESCRNWRRRACGCAPLEHARLDTPRPPSTTSSPLAKLGQSSRSSSDITPDFYSIERLRSVEPITRRPLPCVQAVAKASGMPAASCTRVPAVPVPRGRPQAPVGARPCLARSHSRQRRVEPRARQVFGRGVASGNGGRRCASSDTGEAMPRPYCWRIASGTLHESRAIHARCSHAHKDFAVPRSRILNLPPGKIHLRTWILDDDCSHGARLT